ncbi:hypothetical protein C8F01DRAFT_1255906 [Mycena amicta]|nr:hypothetical protein C8F01DRAFT_1255906 [Mycena amicta]
MKSISVSAFVVLLHILPMFSMARPYDSSDPPSRNTYLPVPGPEINPRRPLYGAVHVPFVSYPTDSDSADEVEANTETEINVADPRPELSAVEHISG